MTANTRIPQAEITGIYGAIVKRLSKKMLGEVPEPLGVMWQHRKVLKTLFGFSSKAEKWNECDPQLKTFAHMAAVSLVGCSFCLDLAYFQAHNENLDVDKAREVPRWRVSEMFTPLERDVMEYAEAMSQTPPTVTDDMSGRLLEQLGAPGTRHQVAGLLRCLWTAAACRVDWSRTLDLMSDDPFVSHRSLLFTVAYETLGSAADAEDVVQETWLRWLDVDHDQVRDPRAYLVRIVTRQALNRLRALARRREDYVEEWLPEPVLTSPDVADDVVLAESGSMAMLTVLETLEPTERAVFVLREVFDTPYDEIADAVGKTPAAVRQITHRARDHVAGRRPRVQVSPAEKQAVVDRFLAALNSGDIQGLLDVLAPDVVAVADGGGQVAAARHPVEARTWWPGSYLASPGSPRPPPSGSCGSTGRPRCGSTSTASSSVRPAWSSKADGSPGSSGSPTRTNSPGSGKRRGSAAPTEVWRPPSRSRQARGARQRPTSWHQPVPRPAGDSRISPLRTTRSPK
jgi:RNA polymerase sigma-70 factor (ECF subfamily)